MKKYILTFFVSGFLLLQLAAQQAFDDKIEYQKKTQETFAIEFPYPAAVVEDALVERMGKLGYKTKEAKGFRNYKGTIIKSISSESMDYVFRVERKSRKEKDVAVVYMLIMKGDANMYTLLGSDIKSSAKNFLNEMAPFMAAFNLEVEISKQEEEVARAEKKLRKLEDDSVSLQKKLMNLQRDIEENSQDQASQQKELAAQKEILEAMKAKRND